MPWAARRTPSKVKSRAMRPRQPDVPNLMLGIMGKPVVSVQKSVFSQTVGDENAGGGPAEIPHPAFAIPHFPQLFQSNAPFFSA